MILPTFLVAGAARCGTSFLCDALEAHPDVFVASPRRPEPKFFAIDELYDRGLEDYAARHFASANGFAAVGEKSTVYLEQPRAAERIATCLPDVRLIFVLRDPIERAYSNYLWSVMNGLEELPFLVALRREKTRESEYAAEHRYSRPFSYVSRGMYSRLLAPFALRFGPDRMRIVLLEDLTERFERTMEELFDFLGVRAIPIAVDPSDRVNSANPGGAPPPGEAVEYLSEVFRGPNQALSEMIGRDLCHWNRSAPVGAS